MDILKNLKKLENFQGSFKSYENILSSAPRVDKAMVYCEIEDLVYQYDIQEQIWNPMKNDSNMGISLYDINKQAIEAQGEMPVSERMAALVEVEKFKRKAKNKYYMLLFREINYYTIFVMNNKKASLSEDLLECLNNIGTIYDISPTDDGAIEIWIKADDELTVGYLFPYDAGIVEVG